MDESRAFELGDNYEGKADRRPVDGHLHGPPARHSYQTLGEPHRLTLRAPLQLHGFDIRSATRDPTIHYGGDD